MELILCSTSLMLGRSSGSTSSIHSNRSQKSSEYTLHNTHTEREWCYERDNKQQPSLIAALLYSSSSPPPDLLFPWEDDPPTDGREGRAIAGTLPERGCVERAAKRPDVRLAGDGAVRRHLKQLGSSDTNKQVNKQVNKQTNNQAPVVCSACLCTELLQCKGLLSRGDGTHCVRGTAEVHQHQLLPAIRQQQVARLQGDSRAGSGSHTP